MTPHSRPKPLYAAVSNVEPSAGYFKRAGEICGMSERAVSSPVGIILIIGMTVASVAALFAVGGTVVSDTRADAEQSQMENAMSSFSSKVSLVGLGESGDQRFSLGRATEGDMTIQPDAGRVTLRINSSDDAAPREINSTSLGAIVYQSGDTEIAYQGGGIWKRTGGYSQMISPPEYHYRLNTLTFPIMTVQGEGRSSGSVRGTAKTGDAVDNWFPVRDNESLSNPLDDGTVSIEVESRYCSGWESFFRERSQGSIAESCGDNDTVVVDLVVPFELTAERSVAGRSITTNGDVDSDSFQDNVVAPSISPEVTSRIEHCGCESFPDNNTIGAGDYFEGGDYSFGDVTFDTTDGDVTVTIDGDLNLDGDIDINGNGNVTMYVDGDVNLQPGGYNTGGEATQLSVLVHTSGDSVDLTNNLNYVGVIYAPGSTIEMGGTTDIDGAVVGDDVLVRGDVNVTAAEGLDGYQIVGGGRPLTYLHVSKNSVDVSFG
jgi:hypothetical protein